MSRFLPLILFLLLGALLAVGLTISDTKTHIPSPLIGRPVPDFDLPVLDDPARRLGPQDFSGAPYLINFWASWCVTCVVEHPVITDLARSGRLRVVGLNFRDEPDDALGWLARHGDPYAVSVSDYDGRVSINFGVYAAPESFLVDPQGEIVYKHIGALTPEVLEETILPMVSAMQASGS
ncbi:MAG: DsbE family thiol:disulfide interchange protein [Xanthomonadales bacterium]|nr:DsbE family thiol:disulfide interchange protein [Xanthomonadales bacterium]NIT46226.1 DsbE family thiol:disulfide interchange protein [Stutzerimonas stutzeri]NIN59906.1 DsbE family thiol:disulfide interchange protein [Xanthomonadales bacterium]NIN75280.1 DsbE family thiol:disulfide interchange protein [Xanthomonadales bacterium]NIO15149.1 DsbE family thiol:disulfide interchange protein [Xanthomonadales bacterium]